METAQLPSFLMRTHLFVEVDHVDKGEVVVGEVGGDFRRTLQENVVTLLLVDAIRNLRKLLAEFLQTRAIKQVNVNGRRRTSVMQHAQRRDSPCEQHQRCQGKEQRECRQ